MCRFIETIKIEDGKILNLHFHNLRLNATRKDFFGAQTPLLQLNLLRLEHFITFPASTECTKCRVVYAEQIEEITYSAYEMRKVNSLKLVFPNAIEYPYKKENREALQKLFAEKGAQDEVLIVRDGLLTDTSIANIALYDGHEWITPSYPLLRGTKRTELLARRVIREADIPVERIFSYSKIAFFNAMIDFEALVMPINKSTIFE